MASHTRKWIMNPRRRHRQLTAARQRPCPSPNSERPGSQKYRDAAYVELYRAKAGRDPDVGRRIASPFMAHSTNTVAACSGSLSANDRCRPRRSGTWQIRTQNRSAGEDRGRRFRRRNRRGNRRENRHGQRLEKDLVVIHRGVETTEVLTRRHRCENRLEGTHR